ncbi:D-amino-acid oxidase [Xaviernesmea oryzae]|uniref:D-amino-acid oxidase n=1 Tax=Xaviernesmea oryzae TaxID=464029 RepID=A0A1Q9AVI0_9HYPH|nr:FAD-dependent oxidoreductase [Xaviernesmea oryzae]OLP59461.1 D-amino-acid oxidase [Xaviernesmea oryzae]SEL59201.1 Glycine/D-amino acid oxidase [Xaviernesmea oryzae]
MPAVSSIPIPALHRADVLVIGGGVMGLWAGVMALRAGLSVCLIEASRIGAGASGGLLGALMPHMPDRWNEKKALQREALVSLESEIARIEAETGLSCFYRRCGRIMPLLRPQHVERALRHGEDAAQNWPVGHVWRFEAQPGIEGWPDRAGAPAGIVVETLTARLSPRALLGALDARLRADPHCRVIEDDPVRSLDAQEGSALSASGLRLGFSACIVAAGVESFPFLAEGLPSSAPPLGQKVKGQAALLDARIDPALPILFADGLYVVAHENGQVAIGSTSEEQFADPASTDEQLDALIARAVALAPGLAGAPVIERWAGLRPKAIGREPMVGRHPDLPRLFALTGGFKISFGIAHHMAEAVVGEILGRPMTLPQPFLLATHMSLARTGGKTRA